jgi:hypothetical protein
LQGARARVASQTPERRREIAREANRVRWAPRVAHQRLIHERAALQDPRPELESLAGCTVEPITRAEAKPIILRFEWLGTMGAATAWYGLRSPTGELLGAVGFGRANVARDLAKLGRAVCLQRGACVHYAPRNAASFLIRRAVKLAAREHAWQIFYAYGDPSAGEVGQIYQALSWSYVGTSAGRSPGRKRDQFIRPDGRKVDERMLRHGGLKLADVIGWKRVQASPKFRYVWIEDPKLRASSTLPRLPYPKRPTPRLARETARAGAIEPDPGASPDLLPIDQGGEP